MRLSSVSRPGVPTTINGLFTLRASACNIVADVDHPEQLMRSHQPDDELIQCKGSCQDCHMSEQDRFACSPACVSKTHSLPRCMYDTFAASLHVRHICCPPACVSKTHSLPRCMYDTFAASLHVRHICCPSACVSKTRSLPPAWQLGYTSCDRSCNSGHGRDYGWSLGRVRHTLPVSVTNQTLLEMVAVPACLIWPSACVHAVDDLQALACNRSDALVTSVLAHLLMLPGNALDTVQQTRAHCRTCAVHCLMCVAQQTGAYLSVRICTTNALLNGSSRFWCNEPLGHSNDLHG